MIIFGNRPSIKEIPCPTSICPECKQVGLNGTVIRRYFHLYYCPVITTSKTMYVTCNQCENIFEAKPVLSDVDYRELKHFKHGWVNNIGSAIIAILFTVISVVGQQQDTQTQQRIQQYQAAPQANTLVVYKDYDSGLAKYLYYAFKIEKVVGEYLQIRHYLYSSSSKYKLERLLEQHVKKGNQYFTEYPERVNVNDLQKLNVIDVSKKLNDLQSPIRS